MIHFNSLPRGQRFGIPQESDRAGPPTTRHLCRMSRGSIFEKRRAGAAVSTGQLKRPAAALKSIGEVNLQNDLGDAYHDCNGPQAYSQDELRTVVMHHNKERKAQTAENREIIPNRTSPERLVVRDKQN